MMKNNKKTRISIGLAIGIIVMGLGVQQSWAASEGTSAGLLLVSASTARAAGLAGTGGTLVDDPTVVFYNPAGLATATNMAASFTHQTGLIEDYSETISFLLPVEHVGVMGMSVVYHGMTALNDAGPGIPEVNVWDLLVMASFGRQGDDILEGFSYGGNIKFLNAVLGEYNASTVALDLGAHWKLSPESTVGLSIRNLGLPLVFIEEQDQLPIRFILSGRYDVLNQTREQLFVVADVEQTLENDTLVHMGTEFLYAQFFALRLGYKVAPESTDGLTFGLGLQVDLGGYKLLLNYAYQTVAWENSDMDGMNLVTLGVEF
jgi:hypothetical protein